MAGEILKIALGCIEYNQHPIAPESDEITLPASDIIKACIPPVNNEASPIDLTTGDYASASQYINDLTRDAYMTDVENVFDRSYEETLNDSSFTILTGYSEYGSNRDGVTESMQSARMAIFPGDQRSSLDEVMASLISEPDRYYHSMIGFSHNCLPAKPLLACETSYIQNTPSDTESENASAYFDRFISSAFYAGEDALCDLWPAYDPATGSFYYALYTDHNRSQMTNPDSVEINYWNAIKIVEDDNILLDEIAGFTDLDTDIEINPALKHWESDAINKLNIAQSINTNDSFYEDTESAYYWYGSLGYAYCENGVCTELKMEEK